MLVSDLVWTLNVDVKRNLGGSVRMSKMDRKGIKRNRSCFGSDGKLIFKVI